MTIRRTDDPLDRLTISGLVHAPGTWSVADLAGLPGVIDDLGERAAGFVGAAAPLGEVLAAVEPQSKASHCTVISGDGHYRASIPLAEIRDKGWVAFGLAGGPLPVDQGGPLRVVVPQGRTLCWNVKAVVALRLTAGAEPDSVPENPTH